MDIIFVEDMEDALNKHEEYKGEEPPIYMSKETYNKLLKNLEEECKDQRFK